MKGKVIKIIVEKIRLLLGHDPLDYVNGSESLPPPLKASEEQEVFKLLEKNPKAAREKLITHNLRLVVYISKKFESTGIGIEDLVSIGTIGLIKAVNTFNPEKNEILMYLRKTTQQRSEISIDEPLNIDWDGNELLLSDVIGTDNDEVSQHIESETEREVLIQAVNALKGREKMIMQMRFGLNGNREMTQKEVADVVGISQSYISRLEKRILKDLKKELEAIC